MITATIDIGGKKFHAKGESIPEAISNLSVGKAYGRGLLTVADEKQAQTRILPQHINIQLFNPNPTIRAIMVKKVSERFGF